MKKLIIAATIVCAAVASQAATFSWSADGTQYMPTSWTAKKDGSGQASGNTSTKKIANWVNGGMDFTAAILLSEDGTTWTPSAVESYELDTTSSFISVDGVSNDLWPNPMVDKTIYYKIIVTGSYTDDSGTWTATGTIGGTMDDYFELTAQSADKLDTPTVASWDISFQGTGPVPEPTSGLMLLLGVGALALRRKQK